MDDHLNNLDDADFYLRRTLDDCITETYDDARDRAAFQTDLPLSTFPAAIPFSQAQILDPDYFP